MRRWPFALLLGVASLPLAADQVRCLQSSDGGKAIRLSLTLFSEESRAGAVRYAGQADSLPLVLKGTEVVDEVEGGRPWEFVSTWLEVLPDEERIGGRYSFHHQGAVLFDFHYHNLRTGRTYRFEEDRDALDETDTCTWPAN